MQMKQKEFELRHYGELKKTPLVSMIYTKLIPRCKG